MEKYFWTLTQPDSPDAIKPRAHDCESMYLLMFKATVQDTYPRVISGLPLITCASNSEYCLTP